VGAASLPIIYFHNKQPDSHNQMSGTEAAPTAEHGGSDSRTIIGAAISDSLGQWSVLSRSEISCFEKCGLADVTLSI
jgi:hypothetical protein